MTYEIELTCVRPPDPLVEVPWPTCIHVSAVEAYWRGPGWHYKLSGQDQNGNPVACEFDLFEPVAISPGGEYPIKEVTP